MINLDHHTTLGGPPALGRDDARWRLPFVLLTLAGLIALLVLRPWHQNGPARSLDSLRLTGGRGPVCKRLVVANDVSGSMSSFAAARSAALAEIRSWAPGNLRRDDQLGVIDFAGNAVWQSRPTSVDAAPGPASGRLDEKGTNLAPVLQLVGRLPASPCDTALIFLSDGLVSDLPASQSGARAALTQHGIHDVFLLVPGTRIPYSHDWAGAFPEAQPVQFNGLDAGATGLAVGHVVSALTGQQLTRA